METITLESEWQRYHKMVYPDGMSKTQENELRRCWFAACYISLIIATGIVKSVTHDEAKTFMEALTKDAGTACEKMTADDAKNN